MYLYCNTIFICYKLSEYRQSIDDLWNKFEPHYLDAHKLVKSNYETVSTTVTNETERLYNDYEKLMDPQTRQLRSNLVFWPTFTISILSVILIRRPRKIIRNTLMSYSLLSLMLCKENFNPLK